MVGSEYIVVPILVTGRTTHDAVAPAAVTFNITVVYDVGIVRTLAGRMIHRERNFALLHGLDLGAVPLT